MSKSTFNTLLRVGITLLLLAFLFSRIDVQAVTTALRNANPFLILIAIVLYFGALIANALKWGLLLRAQKVPVAWGALFRYSFVGVFFNNVLPAAVGGDVMRGYQLAQDTQRRADAAASVVVDRLVGLMALTSTAVVSILYAELQPTAARSDLSGTLVAAIAATVLLAIGFTMMVSRRIRGAIGTVLDRIAARFPVVRPIVGIYQKLAEAVGAYRDQPLIILAALLMGVLPYLFSNAVNYVLSLSLSPATPISLLDIFIYNPLIGLLQILPISIGGLGLNQNLYSGIYHTLLGYEEGYVVALSFLMQFVIYASSLPGGVIWWLSRSPKPPAPETAQSEQTKV